MVNPPMLHPKFWSEEVWHECAKIEIEYLFLLIKKERVVVHWPSRTSFNLTDIGFDLLNHFTILLEMGTLEYYAMAKEVRKILLNTYPVELIDQVEAEILDRLITPKLIH